MSSMSLIAAPNPYETGLDKGAANFVPLSPIGFLLRAATVYPDRRAVVYGGRHYSCQQALERSRRLARRSPPKASGAATRWRSWRRTSRRRSKRISACRWRGPC
jgi:hypothetical protein